MRHAEARARRNTETGEPEAPRLRVALSRPPAVLPLRARRRLAHLLIAKSVAETVFVAALAVGFYYVAFSPYFRGAVDRADERAVSGWVVNAARPAAPVEVQLYVDGRFAAAALADGARPDVRDAGHTTGVQHGFAFRTPPQPEGEHEARVYAVHAGDGGARRTLQLVGQPVRFSAGLSQDESPTGAAAAGGGGGR